MASGVLAWAARWVVARLVREVMPSLWKVCRRWVSTVGMVMNRCWAICRLDRPSAASAATRRSAVVRDCGPVSAVRRGRARDSQFWVYNGYNIANRQVNLAQADRDNKAWIF